MNDVSVSRALRSVALNGPEMLPVYSRIGRDRALLLVVEVLHGELGEAFGHPRRICLLFRRLPPWNETKAC